MTDEEKVTRHITLVRELSNELAAYLHTLPEDVWRNANQYGSGCEGWKVADVVTHLVSAAMLLRLSISRALKGEVSPPLGYKSLAADDSVDRVVSLRVTFDEDLFPEFNTACKQLNTLLASLEPDTYHTHAWHPDAPMPISLLIEWRALELAVHGWDVRYGLDRAAGLSASAIPFLLDFMPAWLRTYFRGDPAPASPVRYRFDLGEAETQSRDIVVAGDDFQMAAPDRHDPDVIFRCDADTYILFATGRLPFARSVRRGRLSFEGDEALAAAFTGWFPTRQTPV